VNWSYGTTTAIPFALEEGGRKKLKNESRGFLSPVIGHLAASLI